MVFRFIQNVVRQRSNFLHRVHAGLQIVNKDLAAIFCGTIQIAGAVLDPGDAEGNAIQGSAVRTGLDQPQAGLLRVGKYEFHGVVGM